MSLLCVLSATVRAAAETLKKVKHVVLENSLVEGVFLELFARKLDFEIRKAIFPIRCHHSFTFF